MTVSRPSPYRRWWLRLVDAPLALLMWLVAPLLRGFARQARDLPLTRGRADAAGIAIVRHHYTTPVIMEADLHRPLDAVRDLPGIRLDLAVQRAFLAGLDYGDELRAIPMQPGDGYGYANDFFGAGDAELLYGIIRRDRPRRIIEIGAGWSSLLIERALARNAAEGAPPCQHLCIEPYNADRLEARGMTVERQRVERLDPARFDALDAGDILFVDSSHVVRPQGDVVHEVLAIYPRLKPGVLVHVHDIFTPRDYPRRWLLHDRQLIAEQYLLEALLSGNDGFEIVCALNWLARDHRSLLAAACPVLMTLPAKQPGSMWLRRTAKC